MSARRVTADAGNGAKSALAVVVVLLIAVGMMLLLRASPSTDPFDPRSGSEDGARGLVVLLERFGADVEVSRSVPDGSDVRRVLVLQDRMGDDQRAELQRWVRDGGILVMADPDSPLAGPSVGTITGEGFVPSGEVADEINVPLGPCTIGALRHLRGLYVEDGVRFPVDPAAASCFATGDRAFAVLRPDGDGAVVQLGDNSFLTNRFLRYADNGGLATALLAPEEGAQVTILVGSEAPATSADIGSGEQTLLDLVRPGVWMAIAQLAIAFLVFAMSRAVRPGRPVREPDQVPIAGSELVAATGRLMQRARHHERAGALLRAELHRELCAATRTPAAAPIDVLDAAVAARSSVAPGSVVAVLQTETTDEQQLLDLTHRIQEIRDLVTEGAHQ
ncbi:MAG: hypothetical protein RL238_1751 [Actinomycetota bacterium]|jgi:hypothetical protein